MKSTVCVWGKVKPTLPLPERPGTRCLILYFLPGPFEVCPASTFHLGRWPNARHSSPNTQHGAFLAQAVLVGDYGYARLRFCLGGGLSGTSHTFATKLAKPRIQRHMGHT